MQRNYAKEDLAEVLPSSGFSRQSSLLRLSLPATDPFRYSQMTYTIVDNYLWLNAGMLYHA